MLFDEAAAGATIAAVWCRVVVRGDGGIGSGDAGDMCKLQACCVDTSMGAQDGSAMASIRGDD